MPSASESVPGKPVALFIEGEDERASKRRGAESTRGVAAFVFKANDGNAG